MAPVKVILLACGSFNPVTNMHLRMFEIARDHMHRLGNHVVIGGLISPTHDGYGKKELEAATHRLAMAKLALHSSDWIKLSDWECRQESWSRTKQVLQYHQNHLNALLHNSRNNQFEKLNEDEGTWVPSDVKDYSGEPVQIKLLCGADLLESFGTPGLWSDDDIEAIVGQHGLVVITRSNTNPLEFIYNSDVLTKYMSNITLVTEWIQNEVSSTKIRRALKRSESVKYLLPDKVIDYIHKYGLYSSKSTYDKRLSIDTVDNVTKTNLLNTVKHPGQAVKIITQSTGDHRIVKQDAKEVCKEDKKPLKNSKSCANIDELHSKGRMKSSKSNTNLKECKSCDENLIKFIFTKHGIQVISDVETIV